MNSSARSLGWLVALRWRRRRFYLDHRPFFLLAVACGLAGGFFYGPDVASALLRSRLAGRPPVAGQLAVRPVERGGAVLDAYITATPLAPVFSADSPLSLPLRLVLDLAPVPDSVVAPVDFAGRWTFESGALRPWWRYRLVAVHGSCRARVVREVSVGVVFAVYLQLTVLPCGVLSVGLR